MGLSDPHILRDGSPVAVKERVQRMRFGIGMNTGHTLEEVGQQFSVTRERIRQIEAKALRKLKHPSRSRKLRSFLDNQEVMPPPPTPPPAGRAGNNHR